MKENRSSSTADVVTIARAYWTKASHQPVFPDQYAIDLLPHRWQRMLNSAIGFRTMGMYIRPVRQFHASVIGRARYVEEALEAAIKAGATQYIIVGAGMDSFAYRRPDLLRKLSVIEIDHPATQAIKKKRLEEANIQQPANLEYLAVDFTKENVGQALQRCDSYDADKKTVFCWMGVSYYLDKATTYEALSSMADCSSKGSEIIFDYLEDNRSRSLIDHVIYNTMRSFTGIVGEPMIGVFKPKELHADLESLGLAEVEDIDSDTLNHKYFEANPERMHPAKGLHTLHTRVV